jgi:hypothetical protein
MKLKSFAPSVAFALFTHFALAASFAQTPDQPPPDSSQGVRKESEQKATATLDALLADVQSLRLPENRARALAQVAHLLWPRDEGRARELFEEAVGELVKLNNQTADDLEQEEMLRWPRRNLRTEVLNLVAQRDAGLALKYLAATRADSPPEGAEGEPANHESRLALQLASQVAARDPQQALAAVEASLSRGEILHEAAGVLHQLWNSDREAAVKVAGRLAAGLRADTLAVNHEAFSLAGNLLGLIASQDGASGGQAAADKRPLLPASAIRQLIEQMYAAARSGNSDRNVIDGPVSVPLMQQLQSAMATVEKYAPATAAALRKAEPQIRQHSDPYSRAWADLNKLAEGKSIDALLDAAPRALPQVRGEYYQRAAHLALEQGATDRARQIIAEGVSDPAQRRHALANVDRQVMWRAAQESRLDEARALALRLPTLQERVQQFAQLAQQAIGGKNREKAVALLDEARAMVGARAGNQSRLWAQLELARMYAQVAPERGFEMIEPVVGQLDELAAASATVEGFMQGGGFRDGEMLLQHGGMMTQLLQQYGQALAALAPADFERAEALAARFQRAEARILTRLGMLQSVHSGQAGQGQAGGIGRGAGGGRSQFIPLSPPRRRG